MIWFIGSLRHYTKIHIIKNYIRRSFNHSLRTQNRKLSLMKKMSKKRGRRTATTSLRRHLMKNLSFSSFCGCCRGSSSLIPVSFSKISSSCLSRGLSCIHWSYFSPFPPASAFPARDMDAEGAWRKAWWDPLCYRKREGRILINQP